MASMRRELLAQPYDSASITAGFANFTLDQATDALEVIFQAAEAVTISRLGFRYGVRTGTPPTFQISLQGVDGSGFPDGVIKGGGSPASATFTPPASAAWDSTWQWITLANSYVSTRGELLSMVIARSSGTIDGSNNSSFSQEAAYALAQGQFPYPITNNNGTRTKLLRMPVFGYGSVGTAYGRPVQATMLTTINSGTTPDEYGLRFKLEAGWGTSCQVVGVRTSLAITAGSSYKAVLYDGTTVLQDVTMDSDHVASNPNAAVQIFFDEASLSTLVFGNVYRIAIQPQTAGSHNVYGFSVAANADLAAYPGGIEFYGTQRTDAGAWTDVDTDRPFMMPIMADWTAAAAGGPVRVLSPIAGGGVPVY